MKLLEFKDTLKSLKQISFELPNGKLVPKNFHVTEVGESINRFIDCGGKARIQTTVNLQLWEANDYNHRLHPEKLVDIIELCEKTLKIEDNEIEIEYQGDTTIEKYHVQFEGSKYILTPLFTDCLAKDACGIPPKNESKNTGCSPESGCC